MATTPGQSFSDCARALTARDLDDVEGRLGLPLPPELRQHYGRFNGGVPANTLWPVDEDVHVEVARFKAMTYGDEDFSTIEDTFLRQTRDGVISEDLLPFATDWGGNFFCVDRSTQEVVILFKDTDRNPIRVLATDFELFVHGLVRDDEAD